MSSQRVQRTEEYTHGEEVKLTASGRGGTGYAHTFETVRNKHDDATAVIYFTDLYCNDFGQEPDAPVLWAVTGKESAFDKLMENTPFGTGFHIPTIE